MSLPLTDGDGNRFRGLRGIGTLPPYFQGSGQSTTFRTGSDTRVHNPVPTRAGIGR